MCDLRYSCILFDLDGTVLDTVSDCTSAINRVMDEFCFPRHTNDEVRSYLNNGAKMLIRRALPENVRDDDVLVCKVLARYIECYSEECLKSSVIYDGVLDMLHGLKARGAYLGIVTNKPDIQTQMMIPHYFGDIFSFVCGNSDSVPTKPDARRVTDALKALGKTPNDAVFVGDSYVDVETARNGGIPCIGVAWGFSGVSGFDGYEPTRIVYTAKEITDIAENGF